MRIGVSVDPAACWLDWPRPTPHTCCVHSCPSLFASFVFLCATTHTRTGAQLSNMQLEALLRSARSEVASLQATCQAQEAEVRGLREDR